MQIHRWFAVDELQRQGKRVQVQQRAPRFKRRSTSFPPPSQTQLQQQYIPSSTSRRLRRSQASAPKPRGKR